MSGVQVLKCFKEWSRKLGEVSDYQVFQQALAWSVPVLFWVEKCHMNHGHLQVQKSGEVVPYYSLLSNEGASLYSFVSGCGVVLLYSCM